MQPVDQRFKFVFTTDTLPKMKFDSFQCLRYFYTLQLGFRKFCDLTVTAVAVYRVVFRLSYILEQGFNLFF